MKSEERRVKSYGVRDADRLIRRAIRESPLLFSFLPQAKIYRMDEVHISNRAQRGISIAARGEYRQKLSSPRKPSPIEIGEGGPLAVDEVKNNSE